MRFRKGRGEQLLGDVSAACASFREAALRAPQDLAIRRHLQEARHAERGQHEAQRALQRSMATAHFEPPRRRVRIPWQF